MGSKKKFGAILLCLVIGYLATKSTDLQSSMFGRVVMGGPMVALLVSMIICNIIPSVDKDFKEGTTYCSKQFLNWGIILTGGTLSFADIMGTGVRALPLILFNICLSFAIAMLVGRKIGVTKNTSVLVGGGTCICGGTAIATLSRIIKATDAEIAFGMAAIFLFDSIFLSLHCTCNRVYREPVRFRSGDSHQRHLLRGRCAGDIPGYDCQPRIQRRFECKAGTYDDADFRGYCLDRADGKGCKEERRGRQQRQHFGSGTENFPNVHPLVCRNGRPEYLWRIQRGRERLTESGKQIPLCICAGWRWV